MPHAQERAVTFDATTDPAVRSWRPVPGNSDFPIQNLPYGAFERDGVVRLGIAIGDDVFDLRVAVEAGLFDGVLPDARALLAAPTLGNLLARGRAAWRPVRARIAQLLAAGDRTLRDAGIAERAFVPRCSAAMRLAIEIGDYVDFYSSLQHASNVGAIFRPGAAPLPGNWRWLPSAYHGRAGTIVASRTSIVRPRGQTCVAGGEPVYGPTQALDFELEVAFVTGHGPLPPATIDVRRARETIFGVALLNDWSARDVQTWESQPLGPFLAKSFATSLGDWIVTLDALEPYRVAGPGQSPRPLAHLAAGGDEAYDVTLEVALASETMRARGLGETLACRTNFRTQYWSMAQQLAHAASNGARVRAGDLFGSGTVSGEGPGAWGSLLEATWRGTRPLTLGDGSQRAFLDDGDEVAMRAWATGAGRARVGFGDVRGTIAPAIVEVRCPP
ncbi:MAG: fumarylacetoacetase [Vulcanimicrobiaceae bacterium]